MKRTWEKMKRERRKKKMIVAEWLIAKFLYYLEVTSFVGIFICGCMVAEPNSMSIKMCMMLACILLATMILCNVIAHCLTYHLWSHDYLASSKVVRLLYRQHRLSGVFKK